jgi:hypothetical protein
MRFAVVAQRRHRRDAQVELGQREVAAQRRWLQEREGAAALSAGQSRQTDRREDTARCTCRVP